MQHGEKSDATKVWGDARKSDITPKTLRAFGSGRLGRLYPRGCISVMVQFRSSDICETTTGSEVRTAPSELVDHGTRNRGVVIG